MKSVLISKIAMFLTVGVIPVALPQFANAQALPTATANLGFSSFATSGMGHPDWGSQTNRSFIVGADATRYLKYFNSSIEARIGESTGAADVQKYFMGGMKIERAVGPSHRLHPYAMLGIGYGTNTIQHHGYRDNSVIHGMGGGLDFDVTRTIAFKGDYQYQFWNLGHTTSGLTPYSYTAGVLYHMHFGHSSLAY